MINNTNSKNGNGHLVDDSDPATTVYWSQGLGNPDYLPFEPGSQPISMSMLMPLDIIIFDSRRNVLMFNPCLEPVQYRLSTLKRLGVDGVVIDVWWGLVQRDDLDSYDWQIYKSFFSICGQIGLKVSAILSFHSCGCNIGDVNIPLPKEVVETAKANGAFYMDKRKFSGEEYITLGADHAHIFKGRRTAPQLYHDFMRSFVDNFLDFKDVIVSVEIGMGPCGELRYPSYPYRDDVWCFPHIGEFQCFDPYMLMNMVVEFGDDYHTLSDKLINETGNYNQLPQYTQFFHPEDGIPNDPLRERFVRWYSQCLLNHGKYILGIAVRVLRRLEVSVVAKVAGIHWQYLNGHAAEITAGYYNFMPGEVVTLKRMFPQAYESFVKDSFYYKLAEICETLHVDIDYTCFELTHHSMSPRTGSHPEKLFQQVLTALSLNGVWMRGENALPMDQVSAFQKTLDSCKQARHLLTGFAYLREHPGLICKGLVQDNFANFICELKKLYEKKQDNPPPEYNCKMLDASPSPYRMSDASPYM